MNYVIVGACAAGLAAAEAVRKADAKGNITMLTEEAYFPYSRPSISYFLKGKVKESDMALRKPSFYKTNNINVITNAKVTSIDRKNKTVKVGKKSYPYDKLCRLADSLTACIHHSLRLHNKAFFTLNGHICAKSVML